MIRRLLVSGDREHFTTLAFNTDKNDITILANYAAPFNASWTEPTSSIGHVDRLIGLSEGDESGLLYSFEIDHCRKACIITSQQPTLGAPAHFITLRDNSALALATYYGGSVALYPISFPQDDEILLADLPRAELLLDFSYESCGSGPNVGRQRQCHTHQIIEDKKGLLYAPDLGSDRVWILQRNHFELNVCGWLQCPPGHGPRHAVLSFNETMMYVIGELSHTVIAFDLSSGQAKAMKPIDGFAPSVIPPNIHVDHQAMMDSAEICLHPTIVNVLYVSNRGARHILEREPHLRNVPKELPNGDDIAIIVLSDDGKRVKSVSHVQTGVDFIRGMRLSGCGTYVAVVGQKGGGIEIYSIGGENGEKWTLETSLREGLGEGLKHVVWL